MPFTRGAALFLGLLTLAASLPAEEGPGIEAATDLSLQISTRPEAKLGFTQSFVFPALRGNSPLTRENGLKTALGAEVSPVSVNGMAEITWTPIAFFQILAGGRIGSGWNMALGNGIGINEPQGDGTGKIRGAPFEGLFWGLQGGAALQFDLAAIFPGDWNHVVFRTGHEARYRAFTGAAAGESWVFEHDDGENRNGMSYYGNYFLGYQIPASPFLNTVGILAETDLYLYGAAGGEAWGDNLPRWYFSALFNVTLTPRFGAALILQTRTRRNYGHSDLENTKHTYYQNEVLDRDDPYRLMFYRAALILTLKLR
jgi:hypothetical protein